MSQGCWREVTRAIDEKRHELVLSDQDVASRYQNGGLDMRIFEIKSLNFLQISNVNLSSVPEEVGDLTNLKNLALQGNKIKELPDTIGSLTQIKFFDVSTNELAKVPDSLGRLQALHTLNLSCNNLMSLPNLELLANLAILRIDHNKLPNLPEGIYTLEHLIEIRASHNLIHSITEEISQIESLKILDISNNQLKELPGQLAICPRLKDLNLKDNPLTDNRLRKMTLQCNTRAILDFIASHSVETAKGKKGKKKKTGKANVKSDTLDGASRKIHVLHNIKEKKCVVFKEVMKEIRPFIICAIVKNLDLSDIQKYKKFIAIQTKIHDMVCNGRTSSTIATHTASNLVFPLVYDGKNPEGIQITPLGSDTELLASQYVQRLNEQREQEQKKKKRSQASGVYRFLDLLESQELYPCLISNERVISLPPITNSDATKVNPSIGDILIEVTSSVSLAACKEAMEKLLEELFLLGYISSQFSEAAANNGVGLVGLILEQVRVEHENGQLRSVYPSRADLKFDNIAVSHVE